MIVLHHFGEEVKRIRSGQGFVLLSDKRGQFLRAVVSKYSFKGCIKFDVVFIDVQKELFRSEDPGDLLELVVVVGSLEKWLLVEDHAGHHDSQRPDIQGVVVEFVGD